MRRRRGVALIAMTAAALAASGCADRHDLRPAGTTEADGPAATQQDMSYQTPDLPPPAIAGNNTRAAEVTAERFLIGWTTFIPWDFDPAREWFARWRAMAAPAFVGQMQLGLDDMWNWTWHQQKKAFDGRVEGTPMTWIEGPHAVTRMTINRLVMTINARVNEGDEQRLTYDVFMAVDEGSTPVVVDVRPSEVGAPAPNPVR
jgi:hypothetical protein